MGILFSGERHSKIMLRSEERFTMHLAENLRKAEEKSVSTIRRGMERAREEWADVERKIRKRMRIYPQKQRAMAAAISTVLEQDVPDVPPAPSERRTPIISIHGQDLTETQSG
jgi:hypothetical protein